MNLATIITFLKAILPTKKITAWLLAVIGAGLALFMGVNNKDLKEEFCKSVVLELPTLPAVEFKNLEQKDVK